MNDLNQIIDNNSKAGAADISVQRQAGKFVVARYAGLSYLGHSVFSNQADADGYAATQADLPISERVVVLLPIPPAAYFPSGDPEATLASLSQDHLDRVARNTAANQALAA